MIKILLLGKEGQVGWELQRTLAPLGDLFAMGKKELNLEDGAAIVRAVNECKPDIIVNAAAYTGVEQAEEEKSKAKLVNSIAPGIIAEEAKKNNALLIHFSTDYVFDGTKSGPYSEKDQPNPLNVYGQTKLEGEDNIKAVGTAHVIFRTSWVYGNRGQNFFLTMLKLAREKNEIRVVADQFGSPTWCRMIAEATALVIAKASHIDMASGIYHLSSGGQTSWYGFTKAILESHYEFEKFCVDVIPVSSVDFKTKARRPLNSVLSCAKIENDLNICLPQWDYALDLVKEERKHL